MSPLDWDGVAQGPDRTGTSSVEFPLWGLGRSPPGGGTTGVPDPTSVSPSDLCGRTHKTLPTSRTQVVTADCPQNLLRTQLKVPFTIQPLVTGGDTGEISDAGRDDLCRVEGPECRFQDVRHPLCKGSGRSEGQETWSRHLLRCTVSTRESTVYLS